MEPREGRKGVSLDIIVVNWGEVSRRSQGLRPNISARLVENPEAYKDKKNVDIEKEILEEISLIP